jgi:hypothetical protein
VTSENFASYERWHQPTHNPLGRTDIVYSKDLNSSSHLGGCDLARDLIGGGGSYLDKFHEDNLSERDYAVQHTYLPKSTKRSWKIHATKVDSGPSKWKRTRIAARSRCANKRLSFETRISSPAIGQTSSEEGSIFKEKIG